MNMNREIFRNKVFERDSYLCVICKDKAVDAHHILERRLWEDGGYYLDNGASLCSKCHVLAEQTIISCEEIREKAGITNIILPDNLYEDERYDKWGNIILPNDLRLRGPLFFDNSVSKILKPVLDQFTSLVKYPRTYHLPWSEVVSPKSDRVLSNIDHFIGKKVVVSIKMDGEQSSLYRKNYHARSIDGRHHPSRSWLKNLHSTICCDIPEGWRVCGENLYAKHTIKYNNLKSYFYVFSIWDECNRCLNIKETKEWCDLLNLVHVPIIYEGIFFNEKYVKELYNSSYNNDPCEGYVVRLADSFYIKDFSKSVAKFVSRNFINDLDDRHHWFFKKIILNKIIG